MTFACNAPTSDQSLDAFRREAGYFLPYGCERYYRHANGGEGFAGERYVMLWMVEELVRFNRDYEVARYLPGYLLIGSNGGGEAYAVKAGEGGDTVYEVPFIGMAERYCVPVADSLSGLMQWSS